MKSFVYHFYIILFYRDSSPQSPTMRTLVLLEPKWYELDIHDLQAHFTGECEDITSSNL